LTVEIYNATITLVQYCEANSMNQITLEEGLVLLKYLQLTAQAGKPPAQNVIESERIRILTEYNRSIGQDFQDYEPLTLENWTMFKYRNEHLLKDFAYTPTIPVGAPYQYSDYTNTEVASPGYPDGNQVLNETDSYQPNKGSKIKAGLGLGFLLLVCGGVFSLTAFGGKGGFITKTVTPSPSQEVEVAPTPKPTPKPTATTAPTKDVKKVEPPSKTSKNGNIEPEEEPVYTPKPRRNSPPPVREYERDAGMNNPNYKPPVEAAPRASQPKANKPQVVTEKPKAPTYTPTPLPPEAPAKPPVVIDTPPPTYTPEPPPPAPPKLPDVVVPTVPVEEAPRASAPPTDRVIPKDVQTNEPSLNQPGNVVIIKGGKP
jgi:hypothetical protein